MVEHGGRGRFFLRRRAPRRARIHEAAAEGRRHPDTAGSFADQPDAEHDPVSAAAGGEVRIRGLRVELDAPVNSGPVFLNSCTQRASYVRFTEAESMVTGGWTGAGGSREKHRTPQRFRRTTKRGVCRKQPFEHGFFFRSSTTARSDHTASVETNPRNMRMICQDLSEQKIVAWREQRRTWCLAGLVPAGLPARQAELDFKTKGQSILLVYNTSCNCQDSRMLMLLA